MKIDLKRTPKVDWGEISSYSRSLDSLLKKVGNTALFSSSAIFDNSGQARHTIISR